MFIITDVSLGLLIQILKKNRLKKCILAFIVYNHNGLPDTRLHTITKLDQLI